jgi:hypothetical protein
MIDSAAYKVHVLENKRTFAINILKNGRQESRVKSNERSLDKGEPTHPDANRQA